MIFRREMSDELMRAPGRETALVICWIVVVIQLCWALMNGITSEPGLFLSYAFWRGFFLARLTWGIAYGHRWAWVGMRILLAWFFLAGMGAPESAQGSPPEFALWVFLPAFLYLNFDPRLESYFAAVAAEAKADQQAEATVAEVFPGMPTQLPIFLLSRSLADDRLILPLEDAIEAVRLAAAKGIALRAWQGVSIDPPFFLCAEEDGPLGDELEQPSVSEAEVEKTITAMRAAAKSWRPCAEGPRVPGYQLDFCASS